MEFHWNLPSKIKFHLKPIFLNILDIKSNPRKVGFISEIDSTTNISFHEKSSFVNAISFLCFVNRLHFFSLFLMFYPSFLPMVHQTSYDSSNFSRWFINFLWFIHLFLRYIKLAIFFPLGHIMTSIYYREDEVKTNKLALALFIDTIFYI